MEKYGDQQHENCSVKIFQKVQWGYVFVLSGQWNLNIKYIDSNILKSKYFQKSNSDI